MPTSTTTQTTTIPDYLQQYQKDIIARAKELGTQDFKLPGFEVAGITPMQRQAMQMAMSGVGSYMPMLQAGSSTLGGGISAGTAGAGALSDVYGRSQQIGQAGGFDPSGIQRFMNPYEDVAVQQAMADIGRAGAEQRAALGAQAVGQGAYGGSRQAVQEGMLNRNVLEQQGRTAAQMRQSGYESAAQRAQQAYQDDLTKQLQAGQLGLQAGAQLGAVGQGLGALGMQQAKLGEAQQAMLGRDISQIAAFGSAEQQQRQAELDAQRQTQYQNVMAPFQQLGFYSDVFQGLPMGQTTIGTQTTPNPSLFSQIAGLGMGLYGLSGGQGIGSLFGFAQGGRV